MKTITVKSIPKKVSFAEQINHKEQALKTAIADICCIEKEEGDEAVTKDQLDKVYESLYRNLDYMYSQMREIASSVYKVEEGMWKMMAKHMQGHAPALENAGQVQKYVDTFMPDSYRVEPKVIYASSGQPEKLIYELPLTKDV